MLSRIVRISKDFAQAASVSVASCVLFSQVQPCNSIAIARGAEFGILNYLNIQDPFGNIIDFSSVSLIEGLVYPIVYNIQVGKFECYNELSYLGSTAIVVAPVIILKALLDLQDWWDRENRVLFNIEEPQLFV